MATMNSKKANNKTSAFSRVAEYLDQDKRRILYNTFIMSNFNYCPLIWMFCGKDGNVSINRVHKWALRIMWQFIAAPFAELLARGNECTIHIRNLQKLMLEIYKCLNSENPSFMWNIFQTKDVAYNLRTQKLLQLPSTNTLSYGNDSLSFRGAILWNILSGSMKVWQPVLALRDQLKSGRVTIARAKYVDKESVGISSEVYLYIIIFRL